jgi:putative transposase
LAVAYELRLFTYSVAAMSSWYRKRVRHYNEPGDVHALTFSCYQNLPLLSCDERKRMLSDCIDRATIRHSYRLIGFVYMPDHVHLLVFPRRCDCRVENLLYAIKKPFSFRIKQVLQLNCDPLLERLMVCERPGKVVFRFWREGPGYDRNLCSVEAVTASLEYFHLNPVVAGLCECPGDWKWSSWRYYAYPDLPADPDLPRIDGLPDW